nr:MAG TPA: hypothetical protein [Inoviridae sp.]
MQISSGKCLCNILFKNYCIYNKTVVLLTYFSQYIG